MSGRLVFAVLGCALAAGCAKPRPDREITAEINVRLATDAVLRHYGIEVRVEHGVATLRGESAWRDEQLRAVSIVQSIRGVTHVDNQLRIIDALLVDRVRDILEADALVRDVAIEVSAARGRIRLSSEQTTAAQRERATMIARGVYGVIGVDDHMR